MTTSGPGARATLAERAARGRAERVRIPWETHAEVPSAERRRDAVGLLLEQDVRRDPDLVPLRHARMLGSPFAFYRGAARVMAADLASSEPTGLEVQLCGDAHLSNFGAYASPERRLVFGLNDFDETLRGPFEHDVKRLVTSVSVAARHNGFRPEAVRAVTLACARSYREAMARYASLPTLELWYAHTSEDDIVDSLRTFRREAKKATRKAAREGGAHGTWEEGESLVGLDQQIAAARRGMRKAHGRDSRHALKRLAHLEDGRYRLAHLPPTQVPVRELESTYGVSAAQVREVVEEQFRSYCECLGDDRRILVERFHVVDVARKVVGVGSVGTRSWVVLLQGRDEEDPLLLQLKEATASVLEEFLRPSPYPTPGERVVRGQRLLQEHSDIFLGWTTGPGRDRYSYWRQLRDMKRGAVVETMSPTALTFYARLCGETLARAHARTGDPVALSAYLGDDDAADRALGLFAERYCLVNDLDLASLAERVRDGSVDAAEES